MVGMISIILILIYVIYDQSKEIERLRTNYHILRCQKDGLTRER
jgi:hypothetical protein